ncbi:DUF2268 domain-containing protein [Solibacillus merdavium]|uniref:Peptidase n=1 Tax=Solibacillus merdavium TaxID=2762218 RepID=A0ABR8XNU8_9BACL|nr:DUF2268 domain-containing putative Zn-dependent protease [Solibacillus merdavium]MBD8033605.1 peptidase [Solibacillus merdavium]
MPILDTKLLFEKNDQREQLAYHSVQSIFPQQSPEAVQYELLQQGLLQNGELPLTLDVWQITERLLEQLMQAWDGPDVPIAILPIKNGFVKNGVAYPFGICLFISSRVTIKELHALFAHEYHHICRRRFITEPPTLLDSVILEGLAEHAVESLFGEYAISSWTKRYSMAEAISYWNSYFTPALHIRGLHEHRAYLFGDMTLNLPPWVGYCIGYRIVEAFQKNKGFHDINQLLTLPSEYLIAGAEFKKK